jgi:hypothetical protein
LSGRRKVGRSYMKVILLSYPKLSLIYNSVAVIMIRRPVFPIHLSQNSKLHSLTAIKGYDDVASRFDRYTHRVKKVPTPGNEVLAGIKG